jgi:hypothetical protein
MGFPAAYYSVIQLFIKESRTVDLLVPTLSLPLSIEDLMGW